MRCPQCGKDVTPDADACRRCGYVVGLRSLAPSENTERNPRFAPEAVILGKLGTTFESFLSDRTDAFQRPSRTTTERSSSSSGASQVYVDASLKELLRPEAVLERAPGVVVDERFSDIERRALAEIDGERPIAFVLTRSGLTTDDLCLGIALLVDKDAVRLKTAAGKDQTQPLPKWKPPISETERNPVWSPSMTMPEPPKDMSLLHDVVVKKLRASGLPVPGDRVPTSPQEIVSDTLPGTGPISERTNEASTGEDVRRLVEEALAAEARGDPEGAVRALREATMARPDDAALLNRLGVVLATQIGDFVGAQAALERAVELRPEEAVYANNLRRVVQVRRRE